MKRLTLTALAILTFSNVFSQEPEQTVSGKTLKSATKPKSETKIIVEGEELSPIDKTAEQNQYPIKVSSGVRKNKSSQSVEPKKERSLVDIEREIESINSKMEIVINDPEEDAIAKEQGWYDLMNARLEKLNLEKEEILKQK